MRAVRIYMYTYIHIYIYILFVCDGLLGKGNSFDYMCTHVFACTPI
jgi:hypothetical protein